MSRTGLRLAMLPHELLTFTHRWQAIAPIQSRFASTSHLPRVAQSSIWESIVPRVIRERWSRSKAPQDPNEPKRREWNPATPILVLGVLVGSQAIHLINLKKDIVSFSRKSDAKIALLREVIKRVQAGENVDVEKVLGTGDPKSEAEWEEVMKEIQTDDHLWQERKWKVKRREIKEAAAREGEAAASSQNEGLVKTAHTTLQPEAQPRFY